MRPPLIGLPINKYTVWLFVAGIAFGTKKIYKST
tara:strand:- start:104 stop:205 length:102 start_codon:yes stop_codon:yes gene_type:complete